MSVATGSMPRRSPGPRAATLGIVLAAQLCACGRLGFDPAARRDGTVDVDDASDGDGGTAEVDEPTEAWSLPEALDMLNSPTSDDDPSLTGDGLELVFTSARPGGLGDADIWVSRRASRDDPWGAPEHLPGISSAAYENTPGISADGLSLWFSSTRSGNEDIYVTTRPDRSSPWAAPARVAELSTSALDRGPETFANDLWIVFHSNRAGGLGGTDFYLASRDDVDSPWSPPVPMAINTASQEIQAWISEGGTRVYFNSNRVADNMDFYIARRPSIDDRFGTPEIMSDLSSSMYDTDLTLTSDERYVVFARDGDLLEATR